MPQIEKKKVKNRLFYNLKGNAQQGLFDEQIQPT